MLATTVVMGFVILLFVIIGIVFSMGKGSGLIAGYNTLPEEEKAKYNEKELTKFMGKMMFVLSLIMILWVVSTLLHNDVFLYVGIGVFLAVTLFMIIYVNKSGRFKKR